MDYGEFQHKMCKKVAQLTKVIFHLNTKNDEYEYNIRSVVSSYENEMETLVREANAAIMKYKEAYEANKRKDTSEDQLKQFKEKCEQEKAKSIQEYSLFRKNAEEREQKVIKEANLKVEGYKQEVASMGKKVEELGNWYEEMKRNH